VAIVFLILKRKPKKVKANIQQVKDIIDRSTRFAREQKQYFHSILQMLNVSSFPLTHSICRLCSPTWKA
jgi:hypothetical protein